MDFSVKISVLTVVLRYGKLYKYPFNCRYSILQTADLFSEIMDAK